MAIKLSSIKQAVVPPRQDTGPPWSGAGVGVGRYFEGYHNVGRSRRFKNLIFRKYLDSTIHHQLFKKYRGLLNVILDLTRFTYVLRLSTLIQDLLRFHHRIFRFYSKRSGIPVAFGPTRIRKWKFGK